MADSEQRAQAGTATPAPQTVGQMLKQARTAHDLTLEQVSTELRIEAQNLGALEQDRFEKIGIPVFVKGYLRQYGGRLGLDYRDLHSQYYKQTKLQDVQVQPSRTIKLRDERQITGWIVAIVVLLVVVVGLAVWWLNGGGFGVGLGSRSTAAAAPKASASTTTPAASPAASVSAPAAAPAPAPAPASATATSEPSEPAIPAGTHPAAESAAGLPAPPATTLTPTRVIPLAPQPKATGTSPASNAPSRATASSSTASLARVSDAEADDEPSPGQASFVVPLDVTFDQDSWAEISDARGQRLFYGLGSAGRNAQLRGEPPFTVVLGNAPGVKILVDGEDYTIPTNGRPGDFSRFQVDVTED